MLEYVKRLENKTRQQRGVIIKKFLKEISVPYRLHKFSQAGLRPGENIIVDFLLAKDKTAKKILVTGHYDVWGNSAGANDNGSSVAVLMELIKRTKKSENLGKNIRFVFFDWEETLMFNHKGSSYYVKDFGTGDIASVYNMEMVGAGDMVLLWPISKKDRQRPDIKKIISIFKKLKIPFETSDRLPYFFTSDHWTFVKKHFKKVYTFTRFFKKDRQMRKQIENHWIKFMVSFLKGQLTGSAEIPDILKHYHNKLDDSKFIKEKNLKEMAEIIWRNINAN